MILFYWIVSLIGICRAQLDLPPVSETPTSSVRPNSYVPSQSFRNQDVSEGDDDRSSRSGPPYSSLDDDEPQNREGRVLSNGGSFNGSANSPYTDRNFYDRNNGYNNYNNDRNNDRYNNDLNRNRYNADDRNRYYVDERERERNYNRFNDDQNRYNNRNPFNDENRDRSPYDNRNRYNDQNRNPYDNRNDNPYDSRNNNPYDNKNQYDDRNRNPYDSQDRNPYRNGGVFVDERDRERNLNRGNVFGDDRNRYEQDYRYQQEMEKLRNFLSEIDHKGSEECTENVAAQWDFETNVNDHTSTSAVSTNCNCLKLF